MSKPRDIAVIGLGTFGSALARELTRMGDRVTGVDRDRAAAQTLNSVLDVAVTADATDMQVLEHAGFEDYDAVIVAIGENMQASLLTAMNVQALSGRRGRAPELHVKAQTPEHARILRALGITNIVEPEQAHAVHVAQLLHNPRLADFMALGNGHIVAAVHAPVHAPVGGRPGASGSPHPTVADCGLAEFGLVCIGVDIGERVVTARNAAARDTVARNAYPGEDALDRHPLRAGDKLLLVGRRDDLRRFTLRG